MAINTYSFDVSSSNPAYAAISHANQTGLDINGNLTISFWVKDLSTVTSQVFTAVSKYDASGGYRVSFSWPGVGNPFQITVNVRQNVSTVDSVTTSLPVNPPLQATGFSEQDLTNFIHFCIVVDFSGGTANIKKYMNGVLIKNSTGTTTSIGSNTVEFAIGAQSGGTNNLRAIIDEVKIWDAALPIEMVIENMRESLVQTACQGYWNLNNQLFDQSSNVNHLIETGGSVVFSTEKPFITYGRTSIYNATAGDGEIRNNDAGWTVTRNATTGDSVNDTTNTASSHVQRLGGTSRTIWRMFVPFDTSDHENNATPVDSYLYLFADGATPSDSGDDLVLVQTSQFSTDSLELDDFDQCGSVDSPDEGMVRVAGPNVTSSVGARYMFQLNATGLTWLNLTGISKLGMRMAADVDDSEPGSAITDNFVIRTLEYSSANSRPWLHIVDNLTPQDIESGETEPVPDSGGDERDPGGQGTPGYIPGGSGSANGGSSAGESALFFGTWLGN